MLYIVIMHRYRVTIHDGEWSCVDGYDMMNTDICEKPEKHDAYFLRWCDQLGIEKKAHLVAASAEHISFGHGQQACPERFFAANEVKGNPMR
jgi:hypothetical protein